MKLQDEDVEIPKRAPGRPKKFSGESSRIFLARHRDRINKDLIDSCARHSVPALRLYFELTQHLGKQANPFIELSADDYFKIRQEAVKRVMALTGGSNNA